MTTFRNMPISLTDPQNLRFKDVLGEMRDSTLLYSYSNSRTNIFVCDSERWLAISASGRVLLLDKLSGKTFEDEGGAAGPIAHTKNGFVVLGTTTLYFYHYPIFGVNDVHTETVAGTAYHLHTGNSGRLYHITSAGAVTRFALDLESTETGTIPGVTNDICAYCTSPTEDRIYTLEAPVSGSGTVVIKIFSTNADLTTITLVGSVPLTATVNGERYSDISIKDDMIAVAYTNGGGLNSLSTALIDIRTPTDPVLYNESSVSVNSYKAHIYNGTVYFPYSNTIDVYQLPGWTSKRPLFELREKGNALYAPDGAFDPDGNQIRILESDIVKAAYRSFNPPDRNGNSFKIVRSVKDEVTSAETSTLITFDFPGVFAKGEVASMHIMMSLTVNGSNEGFLSSGYDLVAVDKAKIDSLTVQHDSITGGATNVTTIVTDVSANDCSIFLSAPSNFAGNITFDGELIITGAVHHGVGDWC